MKAEDGKLDYEDSSDDEEVKLLLHQKGADERDPPVADIRDVLDASGTQREDWLLTEPLNGARPKWNRAGRPPVVPKGHRWCGWPGQIGARNFGSTTTSTKHAGNDGVLGLFCAHCLG